MHFKVECSNNNKESYKRELESCLQYLLIPSNVHLRGARIMHLHQILHDNMDMKIWL